MKRGGLAALALGLFVVLFLEAACQPFEEGDETWMLQVSRRVSAGEVLYRDVAFGSTPLAVSLCAAAIRVAGAELLVLRALRVLLFVGTILLCGASARRVSGRAGPALLAALGVIALSVRGPENLYSPLAMVFLLLCFLATWEWGERPRAWLLAAAGASAGLAFISKQNVGVLACAAAALSVAGSAREGSSRIRDVGTLAAAFALPVAMGIFPVWSSGGLAGLLDYGFLGKGAYVRLGWVSPLEGLRPWRELLEGGRPVGPSLLACVGSVRHAVIPVALAALIWSGLRSASFPRRERERLLVVSAFAAAAILSVIPRFDSTHLGHALPLLLVGLAYAWSRSGIHARRAAGWSLAFFLGAFFLARYARSVGPAVSGLSTGSWKLSALPHFRRVALRGADEARLRVEGLRIAAASEKGPLLVLTTYPAVLYLLSGVRNPTPFDYPLVTAFGSTGSARTLAALESGAIESVCYSPAGESQRPRDLERFIRTRMVLVSDLGPCTLYGRRER